jgi:kynurenine/2-aminoadipate aminotransferase
MLFVFFLSHLCVSVSLSLSLSVCHPSHPFLPSLPPSFPPLPFSLTQSPIRALMPLLQIPGMVSLGGGLPNAKLFPFESMNVKLRSGGELAIGESDLATALQYSPTPGLPQLVSRIKAMMTKEHGTSDEYTDICITNGSQDAFCKTIEALVSPGDSILVEDPTYSGALSFLGPYGCTMIPVGTDDGGLVPENLERALAECGDNKPRVLYTIPTGQNPGGTTVNEERRRQIYEIACKHNIIILEDDPYYFLDFGTDEPQPPSYLSMDTEHRVVRFDSLSKILSAGFRIGWVTAPKPIVNQIQLHQQATALHVSGISQLLVDRVLDSWGEEGWENHVNSVRDFYRGQRDTFVALADKYLRQPGLASFAVPRAGMFLWFKTDVQDTKALIETKARDAKVILVPGSAFRPTGEASCHVRAAFSTATAEDMDTALQRFSSLLEKEREQQ